MQAKEPERLVSKAVNAINSIDISSPSFRSNADSISTGLKELINIANMLLTAADGQ